MSKTLMIKGPGRTSALHITMDMMRVAVEIVDTSGVMDLWETWRREDGRQDDRPGRPGFVEERTVVILLIILATYGRPLHITQLRDIMLYGATENALRELRLSQHHDFEFDANNKRVTGLWYERIYSAMCQFVAVLDPFPETSYHKRYSKKQFKLVQSSRSPIFVE